MYTKKRRTVRIDLTDNEDLEQYDEIINDPLCSILREITEHRTITEFTGGEDGASTTTKIPFLIVTYEEKSLA